MVSVSKLINNGLLLTSQSVFQDVATPQQASVQQYNILNFLGGSALIFKETDMGFLLISLLVVKLLKFNCTQDMVKDSQQQVVGKIMRKFMLNLKLQWYIQR